MADTTTKTLTAYLVVNWKDESLKTRKTEPSEAKLSPYEIAIPANVEVVVPEVEVPEITARVEVPRANVESGLLEDAAREGDPSIWQAIADEQVEQALSDGRDWSWGLLYELTGKTLTESEVYADPGIVRNYIRDEVQRRAESENEAAEA